MLVLSRKKGETVIITIGDQRIRVMPIRIRGDKVWLGFAASKDVTIYREEIQGEIDAERPGEINYDPTIGEDYA